MFDCDPEFAQCDSELAQCDCDSELAQCDSELAQCDCDCQLAQCDSELDGGASRASADRQPSPLQQEPRSSAHTTP